MTTKTMTRKNKQCKQKSESHQNQVNNQILKKTQAAEHSEKHQSLLSPTNVKHKNYYSEV